MFSYFFNKNLCDVPDFKGNEWFENFQKWLGPMGFYALFYECPNGLPDWFVETGITAICGIDSPRGDFMHAVIAQGKEVLHDPHPDQDGYDKLIKDFIIIARKICF